MKVMMQANTTPVMMMPNALGENYASRPTAEAVDRRCAKSSPVIIAIAAMQETMAERAAEEVVEAAAVVAEAEAAVA